MQHQPGILPKIGVRKRSRISGVWAEHQRMSRDDWALPLPWMKPQHFYLQEKAKAQEAPGYQVRPVAGDNRPIGGGRYLGDTKDVVCIWA